MKEGALSGASHKLDPTTTCDRLRVYQASTISTSTGALSLRELGLFGEPNGALPLRDIEAFAARFAWLAAHSPGLDADELIGQLYQAFRRIERSIAFLTRGEAA